MSEYPDTLLGVPIVYTDDLPKNNEIVLGDLSAYVCKITIPIEDEETALAVLAFLKQFREEQ